MTEQDWLALGVTLFVMSIIGLILWLGLTGAFSWGIDVTSPVDCFVVDRVPFFLNTSYSIKGFMQCEPVDRMVVG